MSRGMLPWAASLLVHLLVAGSILTIANRLNPPKIIDLLNFHIVQAPPAQPAEAVVDPPPERVAIAQPVEPPQPVPLPKPIEPPKPVAPPKPVVKARPHTVVKAKPKPVSTPSKNASIPLSVPQPALATEVVGPLPASVEGPGGRSEDISSETASARASSAPVENAATLARDQTEKYLGAHFNYIRDRVMASLRYPMIARRQGWCGRVKIEFTILMTGKIQNLKVIESSGYPLLDKQALRAAEAAEPFPPPPVVATIVLPVNFELN